MQAFTLRHQVVDLHARTIAPCEVRVRDGRIDSITPCSGPVDPGYLVPGFVDAHVHVESSMLPPSEFARAVGRMLGRKLYEARCFGRRSFEK